MSVELHMLPVPAGDATLIIDRSQGRPYTVLIDAGLAKDEVVSYLQNVGVYHLDLIILSHPDLDHLQGLLSILQNPLMSVGQMWCFDLGFLREFVRTGKIPEPKDPTRQIIYFSLLRTLDGMDKVLQTLGKNNVLTLQVSAGHRLSLGRLYIEVLYPWDGFYNALYSPASIKKLLSKRWPDEWAQTDWGQENLERGQSRTARRIQFNQERGTIDRLLNRFEKRRAELFDQAMIASEEVDEGETEYGDGIKDQELLPISQVGTLYNNLSIVVKIHVLGGVNPPTMLFPGDLSDWTYLVVNRHRDLPSDIFKFPHHGSTHCGVSPRALEAVKIPHKVFCTLDRCRLICEVCPDLWHDVFERTHRGHPVRMFTDMLVRPQHILLFPYPAQGLPQETTFVDCPCPIHSNRRDTDVQSLHLKQNPPAPHVLVIGTERHDICTVNSDNE